MKMRKDGPPEGNRRRTEPNKEELAEQLHYSILQNNLIEVQWLLDEGADPDLGIDPEVTQLFHAVDAGNSEAAWLLLEAGADPNVICNNGEITGTAMDLARTRGDDYKSIVDLLADFEGAGLEDLARETRAKIKDRTIKGLRARFDNSDQTLLYRIAERGDIAQALEIIRGDKTDRLCADDLVKKFNAGESVADVLGRRGKLDLVFAPDLWYGREAELQKLWQAVPERHRAQVDFQQVLHVIHRDNLKRAMRPNAPRLKR